MLQNVRALTKMMWISSHSSIHNVTPIIIITMYPIVAWRRHFRILQAKFLFRFYFSTCHHYCVCVRVLFFICASDGIQAFIKRSSGCDKAFMYIAATAHHCVGVSRTLIAFPRHATSPVLISNGIDIGIGGYDIAMCVSLPLPANHHPKI